MTDHVCTHTPETDALDPATTNQRIASQAVCVWWQLTEFISITGVDTISFLQGVTTQDIESIANSEAKFTTFLTNKAKIIAPALAYRSADEQVLLEVAPDHVEILTKHLRRYKLRAKVEIDAVDLGAVSVVGASAKRSTDGMVADEDGQWFNSPAYAVPARTYVGSHARAHELVCSVLPESGTALADPETVDSVRIAHGLASLSDMLVDFMPAEVGAMEHAVDLEKGCYLGQEPVARLHYRGRANRSLRKVRLSDEIPHDYGESDGFSGDHYLSLRTIEDDRAVGTLTSWANSPTHGRIGLAVVRREIEDGTNLMLADSKITVQIGVLVN